MLASCASALSGVARLLRGRWLDATASGWPAARPAGRPAPVWLQAITQLSSGWVEGVLLLVVVVVG